MLCGGFWRAGSYKVDRQAPPPKVALVRQASLGTKGYLLYASAGFDSLIIISFLVYFYTNQILSLVCGQNRRFKNCKISAAKVHL